MINHQLLAKIRVMSAPYLDDQCYRLISSLEQSKQYLSTRVENVSSYQDLVNFFDSRLEFLHRHERLKVKILSPDQTLAVDLKTRSENDHKLRSLYSFQVVATLKNIPQILNNCAVICLIYNSTEAIPKRHLRLIETAINKNFSLLILVVSYQEASKPSLETWLSLQVSGVREQSLLSLAHVINLDNLQQIKFYRDFLMDKSNFFREQVLTQQVQEIKSQIKNFFGDQKQLLWREIAQIKENYFTGKEVHHYRQNKLKNIFNQIDRLQQQEFNDLKQNIHQCRQRYLNPFLADSWMFELDNLVESSEVKVVRENKEQYLYLVVEYQRKPEYLYRFIFEYYQTKITKELELQWSKIVNVDGQGKLEQIIAKLNHKLSEITILEDSINQAIALNLNLELLPKLDLHTMLDLYCLKLSSRTRFDYNCTNSSWFKLGIYCLIGVGIYLITKIYFGEGRYLGFLMLILHLVNIITGQDQKKIKLKQHQKELKRLVNQKYQILLRLLIEQLIQTLINTLEINRKKIKQQIDAIADLAELKLDEMQHIIEEHKLKIDTLEKDRQQIQSWFS